MSEIVFQAEDLSWGTANAPTVGKSNGVSYLIMPDSVDSIVYLHVPDFPDTISGTPNTFFSVSSPTNSGNVIMSVEVDSYASDADITAETYGTINDSAATAISSTVNGRTRVTVSMANLDSMGANKDARFRIRRKGTAGGDNLSDVLWVWGGRFSYAV